VALTAGKTLLLPQPLLAHAALIEVAETLRSFGRRQSAVEQGSQAFATEAGGDHGSTPFPSGRSAVVLLI